MSEDVDINRHASEDREYKMTVQAILAIRSITESAISAIDNHSKSPAVAAMLREQTEKKS